jgi:hypothetical protein
VPAIGVPNTAPKPPAMAMTSKPRRPSGVHRNQRGNRSEKPAVICTATPSLPADPPNRCVATDENNTSGARRRGRNRVGSWISPKIAVLPAAA